MVSLIIPVYNSENKIARCIKSVLAQTYSDLEIILIDDGSKDKSLEICHQFEKTDKRIRVLTQPNKGVSYTRNRGIQCAQGEYIQFVDSDDYITPDMVQKMVATIQEKNADLVICGIEEKHADHIHDIIPGAVGLIKVGELRDKYPEIFSGFLLNSPVNKLYRKSLISQFFPEELSLGEDLLFNLSYIIGIENIVFLKEIFYFYDITEGSLNRRYREDSIEIAEKLYVESMKFSHQIRLGKIAEVQISKIFLQFLFYGLSDIYAISGKSNQQKKECLIYWSKNKHVRQALKVAKMPQQKQKIAQLLLKYRFISMFHIMMKIKGR